MSHCRGRVLVQIEVSAGQEAQICLIEWCVFERHDSGSRHLVGRNTKTQRGRISTPLKSFDATTVSATTQSGRRYLLVGPPCDTEVRDAWAQWMLLQSMTHVRDVT